MGLALPDPLLAHPPAQALVLHPEQPAGLPEETQGALRGCWGWVSDGWDPPHLDPGVGCSVGAVGGLDRAEDTEPQWSGDRDC